MKSKQNSVALLIFLLIFLFAVNYNVLDEVIGNFLFEGQTEKVFVERIVDGDTIEVAGYDETVRLLGINTPERGELYYLEAKEFLESEILNEIVVLEFVGPRQDKYYRWLAYVHFNGENINVKMVENGFANYYFYDGLDKYSFDLEEAWETCLEKEINLCEPSEDKCSECLKLYSDNIFNGCSFSCDLIDWEIKTEGRDKIVLNETLLPGTEFEFGLGLENSGGSLFLRDELGKLVAWNIF